MSRVIVVGAGVAGLSCAVRLLDAGHRVDVLARDLPLETTSAVAAAVCSPYLAQPQDLVERWCAESQAEFERIATSTDPDDAGVRLLPGRLAARAPGRSGERVLPVIEMPVYLRWLDARIRALGGTISRLNLSALPHAGAAHPGAGGADVVVNCSGLGAKHLAADPGVFPVQGQVSYVAQFGLDRWAIDETGPSGPTYVVPRSREIVVGGTEVVGEWSRTPDPAVAADIWRRATALVPELASAKVLRHKVGLRPARSAVRVERVGAVVHCYGHGGSGVTLAWGTAGDVVRLVSGRDPAVADPEP